MDNSLSWETNSPPDGTEIAHILLNLKVYNCIYKNSPQRMLERKCEVWETFL
jgi:hypothetical protein